MRKLHDILISVPINFPQSAVFTPQRWSWLVGTEVCTLDTWKDLQTGSPEEMLIDPCSSHSDPWLALRLTPGSSCKQAGSLPSVPGSVHGWGVDCSSHLSTEANWREFVQHVLALTPWQSLKELWWYRGLQQRVRTMTHLGTTWWQAVGAASYEACAVRCKNWLRSQALCLQIRRSVIWWLWAGESPLSRSLRFLTNSLCPAMPTEQTVPSFKVSLPHLNLN